MTLEVTEAVDATKTTASTDTVPNGTDVKAVTANGSDGQATVTDAGTILDDAGEAADTKPVTHPATWPEDWREKAVADIKDEKIRDKEMKRLQRWGSPVDAYKSLRSLEAKMSSGEYARKLPENASDEQKAAWRKENGIPEKAADYKLPEIKGHEWTEADKPIVNSFLEALHGADVSQPAVDKALGWYAEFQIQQQEAQFEADKATKQEAEDALRTELGNEYRPSINLLGRLIKDEDVFPGDVGNKLLSARAADGSRLINDPTLVKFLVGFAREKYGEASMISGNEAATLSSREEEIMRIMNTDIDRYWREKNGKGQSLQEELAEIQARKSGKRQ